MRNLLRLTALVISCSLAATTGAQQSGSQQSGQPAATGQTSQSAGQAAPKPSDKPSILPDSNGPVKLSDSDTATVAEAKKDYNQEAFVIERLQNHYRFEADGTGRKESIARIRVQSAAGVQQWGQLQLGYNSANENMKRRSIPITGRSM